ncbi:MFS transporter [Myxococcota bacterium]|nr:MFS transporter [Myxococcota bacterium]
MSGPVSPHRARYALGLLFVVYAVSLVDRQILAMLLEDIKLEMGLKDWQLGFLSGLAFALFYSTAGIPLARLADRGSRRAVIAAGMIAWSIATALSGAARGFWQLALARVAVGVGEAAGSPPSHSLISDLFPPESRARAIAIYTMGANVGVMGGYMLGGWLAQSIGWRWTFVVIGLPGVLVGLLVRFTLPEPPRGAIEDRADDEPQPPLGEALRYLFRLRAYRQLAAATSLYNVASYGFMFWVPAFMQRVHEMDRTEIGLWLGPIAGFVGAAGAFTGGWLADIGSRRDERWLAWVPAIAGMLGAPCIVVFLLIPGAHAAVLWYVPITFLTAMWTGGTYSAVQGLASLRMRATAAAVLLFLLNFIGFGLGPQLVGILSDVFEPTWGRESLRYALLVVGMCKAWGCVHGFLAAKHLRAELAAVREGEA